MTIVGIIICVVVLMIICLLNAESSGEQGGKIIFASFMLMIIIGLVYDSSYNSGVKDGAYNQLRSKYKVTYVIDKDSCVVDTIINLIKTND